MFSFSSNRAKSLVASINMKSQVSAVVSDYFTITAKVGNRQFQFQFYNHEVKNGAIPIKMATPVIVYFTYTINDRIKGRYVVPKFMDMKSWFIHIKTIFNGSEITYLQFYEDVGNFDLDSIRDSIIQEGFIDNFSLMVFTRSSDDYNRKIMKTFRNINYLLLETKVYENGKPPGEVLIQNFQEFNIGVYSINPTTMKLDDILISNSKNVHIVLSELTEKDANRFLKLWMRGNSKFEYFSLRFFNEIYVDRDTLLKGIKFQKVPLQVKRLFAGRKNPLVGGIDIIRRDGIRGTITFKGGYMEFFVWHDYCKVEK